MPALRFNTKDLKKLVEELEHKKMNHIDLDNQGTCFGIRIMRNKKVKVDCLRSKLKIKVEPRKWEIKEKIGDIDKIIFKNEG